MIKIALDDLLGSMQTYEIDLNAQSKDKGIALNAKVNAPSNAPYSKEKS